MTLKDILLGGSGLIIAILTLVQITPIKVNPWSAIAKALGKAFCGDLLSQLRTMEAASQDLLRQLHTLEDDLNTHIVESERRDIIACRVRILRFGDEVIHNVLHSKDSFDQVLEDITMYEHYCDEHCDFKNNMTTLTAKRIKAVYEERLAKNDFL